MTYKKEYFSGRIFFSSFPKEKK